MKQIAKMIFRRNCQRGSIRLHRSARAFTLIELLVVMAIIGILAALIVSLSGVASEKRRRSLVEVEKEKLVMMIESYHEKLGAYPPDNGSLATNTNPSIYADLAGNNPLYYELTGVTFNEATGVYTLFDNKTVTNADYKNAFNIGGIRNAAIPNTDSDTSYGKKFYHPVPKANQHKTASVNNVNVELLVCPVDLQTGQINPWKYDASSTNRHNLDSFDIWADFSAGGKTVTIGNWKQ